MAIVIFHRGASHSRGKEYGVVREGGGGADVETVESNVADEGRVAAEAEATSLDVVEAAIETSR